MESECLVRPIVASDVAAVFAIAACAPESAQWSQADYEQVASGTCDSWVVSLEGKLAGFVVAGRMADEMEILNLAVEPSYRRRGAATKLLEAAMEFAQARGARRVFLEVRASNAGAMAFYQRHGFAEIARRPRSYAEPVEDALVLARALAEDAT